MKSSANINGHDISDLMNSYQQKISVLNDEINHLKQDIINRDNDISLAKYCCFVIWIIRPATESYKYKKKT